MSIIKQPSNIKNGILAQIRFVVSKQLYKAIKYLLDPCCAVDNITGIAFTDFKISGTEVQSQDVTVIILSGNSPYLVGKAVITLDGNGDGGI